MLSVLTTLLEIAMALRHMHSMQLVHCDLKPGNVLLKSSLTDARRFTTKLCDFGLVKFRYESVDFTEQIRRSTFTGTVKHSPPEMLQGDPNPDFAYDVCAFGILMYEIVSLTPVYAGLSDRQVAHQVVYNNMRPTFPKRMNPEYVALAKQCWATDPKERPPITKVVHGISRMLMALQDASSPQWQRQPATG
ncbi:kinase-like domain-containing protein [Dunaliella salina]|uniref:Kinase-like domain-containing protein n=1 Tax=Dunaliella salina TaxID=3046 RepID=A0ABQ7GH27_DUNSA|nr:kinase-like domain-containing protein [Dunaliella salina]|eukprot:KAF5833901.1 kinase-like domain-containing protein [Dunaliella salina]